MSCNNATLIYTNIVSLINKIFRDVTSIVCIVNKLYLTQLLCLKTSQDSILMENLNLDIDSYSLTDLINLFSLNKEFTRKAVDNGKGKLHEQLKKVSYLGAEKKREIGLFIDSAASKLANLKW